MRHKLSDERNWHLQNYKKTKSKESLEFLMFSYINTIKSAIKKYENNSVEHDELLSIAIIEFIDILNNYNRDDVSILYIYISKGIKKKLNSFIESQDIQCSSYEEYFQSHKNGEDGSYNDLLFESILYKNLPSDFLDSIQNLNSNEKKVIFLRYGFTNLGELSYNQIGKILGLHRSRVPQIEHAALHKLRKNEKIKKMKNIIKN